jgi:uncharacterized protein YndB with AHSA1/START domain
MLRITIIGLILALIAFVAVVAIQPAEFQVTRTATIDAPAATVFANVNELQKWNVWSPWAKLDPAATSSFEGPAAGVGAVMSWAGNMEVGVGSMTILESRPNEYIKFKLDFLKPMESTSTAEFAFQEDKGQTTATWSMSGTRGFVEKAMGLVFNCEKMIGEQFDKGLASLKTVAETAKADDAKKVESETKELEAPVPAEGTDAAETTGTVEAVEPLENPDAAIAPAAPAGSTGEVVPAAPAEKVEEPITTPAAPAPVAPAAPAAAPVAPAPDAKKAE